MSYIKLYMVCPSKDCQNRDESGWNHANCGYDMEINERAELRCSYHRQPSNIFCWRFDCGRHSNHSGQSSYHLPDKNKLLSVLACALKFSSQGADDDWIDSLILSIRRTNH